MKTEKDPNSFDGERLMQRRSLSPSHGRYLLPAGVLPFIDIDPQVHTESDALKTIGGDFQKSIQDIQRPPKLPMSKQKVKTP